MAFLQTAWPMVYLQTTITQHMAYEQNHDYSRVINTNLLFNGESHH